MVTKLKQHQRRTLVGRQALDLLHHLAELLAPFDLVRRPVEEYPLDQPVVCGDGVAAIPEL